MKTWVQPSCSYINIPGVVAHAWINNTEEAETRGSLSLTASYSCLGGKHKVQWKILSQKNKAERDWGTHHNQDTESFRHGRHEGSTRHPCLNDPCHFSLLACQLLSTCIANSKAKIFTDVCLWEGKGQGQGQVSSSVSLHHHLPQFSLSSPTLLPPSLMSSLFFLPTTPSLVSPSHMHIGGDHPWDMSSLPVAFSPREYDFPFLDCGHQLSFSASWYNVTRGRTLLLPSFSHNDGLCSLEQRAQTNPCSFKSLLSECFISSKERNKHIQHERRWCKVDKAPSCKHRWVYSTPVLKSRLGMRTDKVNLSQIPFRKLEAMFGCFFSLTKKNVILGTYLTKNRQL